MYADTLLDAEAAHLHRLLLWGAACAVAGMLLLLTVGRRGRSALLFHFALQTLLWGLIDAAIAAVSLRAVVARDLGGAVQLDRMLWLNVGLDAGYVAVGATLALCGWRLGRRLGPVGAGIAIVVQGLALLLLDARFLAFLDRSV